MGGLATANCCRVCFCTYVHYRRWLLLPSTGPGGCRPAAPLRLHPLLWQADQAVIATKGGTMQPDPSKILERLSISTPLIGLYDAPDPAPFEPLVVPKPRQCVFASFKPWGKGKTLHLTRERHGCGAPYLLGVDMRPRKEMVEFLCDEEGLRASHELMDLWLDSAKHYEPVHDHVLIGPLRPGSISVPAHGHLLRESGPVVRAQRGRQLLQPAGRPAAGAGAVRLGLHAIDDGLRRPRGAPGRDRGARPRHAVLPGAVDARLHRDSANVRIAVPLGGGPQELIARQVPRQSRTGPGRVDRRRPRAHDSTARASRALLPRWKGRTSISSAGEEGGLPAPDFGPSRGLCQSRLVTFSSRACAPTGKFASLPGSPPS